MTKRQHRGTATVPRCSLHEHRTKTTTGQSAVKEAKVVRTCPPRPRRREEQSSLRATGRSSPLAELALLIDAIPAEFRSEVLRAALRLEPSSDIETSSFVGLYRTILYDILTRRTETVIDLRRFRRLDSRSVERRLALFACAEDPAQVTLALCELIGFLARSVPSPSQPTAFPSNPLRGISS